MSFVSFDELEKWVKETSGKLGQKVVTTVWLPSRFLEDILAVMPLDMEITHVTLDGSSWESDSYQKIEEIAGIKIYENVATERFRLKGVLHNPTRELLNSILSKSKDLGVRPFIVKMTTKYKGKEYFWQHHLPTKGSKLGSDASWSRFAKALQKTKGAPRILDLKSTHNLKETWDMYNAFNGFAALRACSVSRKLESKIEAVCLVADIKKKEVKR